MNSQVAQLLFAGMKQGKWSGQMLIGLAALWFSQYGDPVLVEKLGGADALHMAGMFLFGSTALTANVTEDVRDSVKAATAKPEAPAATTPGGNAETATPPQ